MKIALTFLISSVLVVGLFLIGCNDKTPPPPPPIAPPANDKTPPPPPPIAPPAPVPPSVPEPPPDPLKGFLTTAQSINWLEQQGYQVEKDDQGYTLKKEAVNSSGNIHIDLSENIRIGWGSTMIREDATITTNTGEIRIKPSQ